jgi:hypothetical protein
MPKNVTNLWVHAKRMNEVRSSARLGCAIARIPNPKRLLNSATRREEAIISLAAGRPVRRG